MGLGFATLATLLGALLAFAPTGLPEETSGFGRLLLAAGLIGVLASIALHVRRHGREHAGVAPPRRTSS